MSYIYKMVQIPPMLSVMGKKHKGSEAAEYLETTVNKMAKGGWEFYRVDSFGVQIQPGCLASLSGAKSKATLYYVLTVRMAIE